MRNNSADALCIFCGVFGASTSAKRSVPVSKTDTKNCKAGSVIYRGVKRERLSSPARMLLDASATLMLGS